MTTNDATALLTHMEWADALVWSAALRIDAAHGDPALKERLHHVHLVQRIYLQMWREQPHAIRELSTFPTLSEVCGWARDNYAELRRLLADLEPARLERSITFPWADELVKSFGTARTATMRETIQQVALHTAHHRGQLMTMIRQLGETPPYVDFITWIWMGRPDPAWPEAARAPDRSFAT